MISILEKAGLSIISILAAENIGGINTHFYYDSLTILAVKFHLLFKR